MAICVESYIGAEGGAEGVKLEEQVLVTGTGTELLSDFPFEADLLALRLNLTRPPRAGPLWAVRQQVNLNPV